MERLKYCDIWSCDTAAIAAAEGDFVANKLWVYALRTNNHFTLKQRPVQRIDFDEFVEFYKPGAIHRRKPTWSDENTEGRWRCYEYDELLKRDKLSLDLIWIKDDSLEDSASLPDPDVLAAEIVEALQDALEQFSGIAAELATTPAK